MYVHPPLILFLLEKVISFPLGYLYISSAIILTLTILIAVYRLKIEKWLEPRADAVRKYVTTNVCFLSAVRH